MSSAVCEGLILGPILLNAFVDNLNSEAEYALSKLVDSTKLVVNMLEGRAVSRGTSRRWRNGLIGAS